MLKYISILFFRGGSIISTFLVNYLLARKLNLHDGGMILSVLSYLSFLPIVFLLGTHSLLLKYVPIFNHYKHVDYIVKILFTSLCIVFLSFISFVFLLFIIQQFPLTANVSDILVTISYTLPLGLLQACVLLFAEIFKSYSRFNFSVVVSSLLANSFFLFFFFFSSVKNFHVAYYLYLGGLLITLLVCLISFQRKTGFFLTTKIFDLGNVIRKSKWIFFINLLQMLPFVGDIFLTELLFGKEQAGIYSIAKKCSLIVFFPPQMMGYVFSQKASLLLFQDKLKLREVLQRNISLSVIIVFGIGMILILLKSLILSVFGKSYLEGSNVFVILVVAHAVNAIIQPHHYILILGESKKCYGFILIGFSLLTFLLGYYGGLSFGIEGIAMALLVSFIYLFISVSILTNKVLNK